MDLNLDYSDDESPLSLKSDFILSLCELIVGGKDGLQPYRKPSLTAVCGWSIRTTSTIRARRICPFWRIYTTCCGRRMRKRRSTSPTALEIYVTGSLNVFNHRSNVDINNRIVCYDIKELASS